MELCIYYPDSPKLNKFVLISILSEWKSADYLWTVRWNQEAFVHTTRETLGFIIRVCTLMTIPWKVNFEKSNFLWAAYGIHFVQDNLSFFLFKKEPKNKKKKHLPQLMRTYLPKYDSFTENHHHFFTSLFIFSFIIFFNRKIM